MNPQSNFGFDWKETFFYYLWCCQNAVEKTLEYISDKYNLLKYYVFVGCVPHCVFYQDSTDLTYTYCNYDDPFSVLSLCFQKYILGKPLAIVKQSDMANDKFTLNSTYIIYKTYNKDPPTRQVYEVYYLFDAATSKTYYLKVDDHGEVHHMKRPKPIAFLCSDMDPNKTEDISHEYANLGTLLSMPQNVPAKVFLKFCKEFYGKNLDLSYVFKNFTINVITTKNELIVYKDKDNL